MKPTTIKLVAFLSRLFGGEPEDRERIPAGYFLSRLFGGEPKQKLTPLDILFLSRLFGGEPINWYD